MAVQKFVIVNASRVLNDHDAAAPIAAIQDHINREVVPAWRDHGCADQVQIEFAAWSDFRQREANYAADGWEPMFLNRHSADPGALGWHTDEGQRIFGRVFVGDCMRYGISWTVDLDHEIKETYGDPPADRAYKMANGDYAALELCDAVEADAQAIHAAGGVLLSNWVLPIYFSNHREPGTKYDFGGHLRGPCPTLTDGGYMSIWMPGKGWQQAQQDRADGLLGRRAILPVGWRRAVRKDVGEPADDFYFDNPA